MKGELTTEIFLLVKSLFWKIVSSARINFKFTKPFMKYLLDLIRDLVLEIIESGPKCTTYRHISEYISI